MLRKLKESTASSIARACAAALSCACLMGTVPADRLILADPGETEAVTETDLSETMPSSEVPGDDAEDARVTENESSGSSDDTTKDSSEPEEPKSSDESKSTGSETSSDNAKSTDTSTISENSESSDGAKVGDGSTPEEPGEDASISTSAESMQSEPVSGVDAAIPDNVKTYKAMVIVDSANVRDNPGTVDTTVIYVLRNGAPIDIVETLCIEGDPTGTRYWFRIYFTDENGETREGVISSKLVSYEVSPSTDEVFEEEIAAFPDDYKVYLRTLHNKHPNWHFHPIEVNKTFEETVASESRLGVSLIYSTVDDSWKSTEEGAYDWTTGEYTVFDGKMWVNASRDVVKYYLDPRNMLDEKLIFQFLDLSYDPKFQSIESVQGLLNGTFMESATIDNLDGTGQITYAEAFMLAASKSGANPVFLAAKVLQEVSEEGSNSTSGNYYSEFYEKEYIDLFNYYNIGAISDKDPVAKGLAFARDGSPDPAVNEKLLLPWNSRIRSLVGGSIFIAGSYINVGQNSTYLMKFNVNPKDKSQFGNHQYMTNIQGSLFEAKKIYKAYEKGHILDMDMSFAIPVYKEMPETACVLPLETGNPNAYLSDLTIDGYTLTPKLDPLNCFEYSLVVAASCKTIHIDAKSASDKAKISGIGDVELGEDVTKVTILVTAENGSSKTYTINVARNTAAFDSYFHTDLDSDENFFSGIDPSSTVGDLKAKFEVQDGYSIMYMNMNGQDKTDDTKVNTGDLVQIVDSEGNAVYVGSVFIRGDANCDGKISSADLTLIARYILGDGTLTEAGLRAADANKDGKVNAADLTLISKHILQELTIIQ
ncbi:MAG: hypothetical protein J5379_06115 [Clostridiales bacterium]|nr:hypothetical protein [Clostridiales bacterium]